MKGVHLYTLFDIKNLTGYNVVLSAFNTPPSAQVGGYYQTMVSALQTAGSWDKCDIFQFYSAHNQADSLINWRTPGTCDPTAVDSPTWTQYQGFTSTLGPPKGYINTNYKPSVNGVNYGLNDATVIVGIGNSVVDASGVGAKVANTNETRINGYSVGTSVRGSLNGNYATIDNILASGIGHFGVTRSEAAAFKIWQNKTSNEQSRNSASVTSRNFWATTANLNDSYVEYTGKQVRYVWAGGCLTDQEYQDTIDAIEACLLSLGSSITNVVTNGGFNADSDWGKGANWTISGGKLVGTAVTSGAYQDCLSAGDDFKITFTITDYTAGTVRARCGITGYGAWRSAAGTYTETITCTGDTKIYLDGGVAFTGKIDNVIIIQQ